ncbi:MAG: glycosyltransferase family 4 protein [Solirubrobacteraceae bacterium]
MKIAFFSTTLPEPQRKPGGVDVNLDRLAERLARTHELTVFSFSPRPEGRHYDHVRLSPGQLRYSPLARLTIVPLLMNARRFSVDVLHLHGDDHLLLRRRLPTVRTFYGSAREEARTATRWLRRANCSVAYAMELLASRLATASYAISPGAGSEFRVRGVLPPGADVHARHDADRFVRPTILFVGTWAGRKRGELLARIFQTVVRPAVPDAELIMVSDHAEALPGVRLVVRPTDAELAALMRGAWVFSLPSSYEGFGIPYLEAMATGVPVVASDNVGSRYVLDGGRAGKIVADDQLGPTIVAILCSGELRSDLSDRGLERAQFFSWERTVSLHEQAYRASIDAWITSRGPKYRLRFARK